MQSDDLETATPPKNKGGRPKGSKNRPKWLLKELKAAKRKTRGRPPGSKNKPKTLEEYIALYASQTREEVRVKVEKPKRPHKISEEERQRRRENMKRVRINTGRKAPGNPYNLSVKGYARACHMAQEEAKRIAKIMSKEGIMPDENMAASALQSAFGMIGEPLNPRDRLAAIRTVLEYTKQKPATQSNVTVRTAEDFLDELAENDGTDEGAEEAPNT